MVFTGSIGLHHVVGALKKKGYANEPTNDMYIADVPPLSEANAIELAHRLLEGEKIRTIDDREVAAAIAQSVSCIPFYIHHLIIKLKVRGGVVDATTIPDVINACLLDPLNPWKMDHYRDRIDNYYDGEQHPYALSLLDILSASEQTLSFEELLNRLRLEQKTQDKEKARDVLRLLERDYYIVRRPNLRYCFRYLLIQKYWQVLRG